MADEHLYGPFAAQLDAVLLQQNLESPGHAVHELREGLYRLEVASPQRFVHGGVDQIHLSPGDRESTRDRSSPCFLSGWPCERLGQATGVLHEFHRTTGDVALERELVELRQAQPGLRRLRARDGLHLRVGSACGERKMTGTRGCRHLLILDGALLLAQHGALRYSEISTGSEGYTGRQRIRRSHLLAARNCETRIKVELECT